MARQRLKGVLDEKFFNISAALETTRGRWRKLCEALGGYVCDLPVFRKTVDTFQTCTREHTRVFFTEAICAIVVTV